MNPHPITGLVSKTSVAAVTPYALKLEHVTELESVSSAWKAEVIPIYDTCIELVGAIGIEPISLECKPRVLPLN